LLARGGRRRSGLAASLAVAQFALSLLNFGLTRLPYLVYPSVRAADALTPPATYTALMLTLAGGVVFVVPSLVLLYVLYLKPEPQAQSGKPQIPGEVSSTLFFAGSRK